MSAQVYQTQFRQEYIASFEQGLSLLGGATTRETVIKGSTATFLIAGTGGATAKTRGVNGRIPARQDSMTQVPVVLKEWHDLVEMTDFNIFANQGNSRQIMQSGVRKVMNRKIDQDILTALDDTTIDLGSAAAMTLNHVVWAQTALANNHVPVEEEDNMFAVVTPAAMGYLRQTKEFTSADYVNVKPLMGPPRKYMRWMGFNWVMHPDLSGVGTASAKCFFFHRDAIGFAANSAEMELDADYDRKDKYSWARASLYFASKLLQNAGIARMLHDDSGFATT